MLGQNNPVGLPKQRKIGLDWYEFLCFESPTALFASQHNLFCTMWPDLAKGLLSPDTVSCFGFASIKKVYQTIETVFHYICMHLEVRQIKYFHLGFWKCSNTLSLMYAFKRFEQVNYWKGSFKKLKCLKVANNTLKIHFPELKVWKKR